MIELTPGAEVVFVRYANKKYTIWCFGLDEKQLEALRAYSGTMCRLRQWDEDMPDFSQLESDPPCLICFNTASCRVFTALPSMETAHLEMIPKVLFLDDGYTHADIEAALDKGLSGIIRPPYTAERFEPVLRKAMETAALHKDILNMTREICLERELLESKNETLDFLVSFLTSTTEQLDEAEVLRTAFVSLRRLFPVLSLNAALTSENDDGGIDTELFIAAPRDHLQHRVWRSLLLEATSAQHPGKKLFPSSITLNLPGLDTVSPAPSDGHIFTLPLLAGAETLGQIILLTNMERNLTRDQALALDSAMRHLALTLKNVRRYQQMCHFAEYDSLTGAHNRRNFEERLRDEVTRHQRYGQPLSLIMLDLDHFKSVNDTWGHMAGDRVLQSTARIIEKTIRNADYCARYGGEEFVILLPHTDQHSATLLAERLRKALAAKRHDIGGERTIGISCSLGVSSLHPTADTTGQLLLGEADAALYEAKARGRNAVVTSGMPDMSILAQAARA